MLEIKTYRQLLEQLKTLSDKQLDTKIECVSVSGGEHYSPVYGDFWFDNEYDVDHPSFVLIP